MVELFLMPSEGRCLKRVKRRPIDNRRDLISWPCLPKPPSAKTPKAALAAELRSPQEILEEIAALDAESAEVLAKIGGLLG